MLDRDSDSSEKALLGDFGSAKDLEGMVEFETSTHMATIRYCSPEQLLCPGEINSAKDIWSLGCVILEVTIRIDLVFAFVHPYRSLLLARLDCGQPPILQK